MERSLAIFRRWKNEVLQRFLMWGSKVRWESILTPRLVITDESGRFWPEKVMLVIGDDLTWCGVPIRMASVLVLFNCRKL